MEGLVRLVVDLLQFLWPVTAVDQWEKGVYYFFGKYWRTVGPGRWPLIPYFMDVRVVSVVESPFPTPLQTITLRDGTPLTFSATVTTVVEDPAKALNNVDQYMESVVELASAVLAEELADAVPERLLPQEIERRKRAQAKMLARLDSEYQRFGVRALALRFNNYALGIRTYRLLTDSATGRNLR